MWRHFTAASRVTRAVARPKLGAPRRLTQASNAPLISLGFAARHGGMTVRLCSTTSLGAYLERCGATWGDAVAGHEVAVSEDGQAFSWRVDLPPERLASLRAGDALESTAFALGSKNRGRFLFFPKGDDECKSEDMCSLWLISDSRAHRLRLSAGDAVCDERGASEFCRLADVVDSHGSLTIEARIINDEPVALAPPKVLQSLQLTGLQLAEWRIFAVQDLAASACGEEPRRISSPPFRFHHVLLGDMYLEAHIGTPHSEMCTLFFQCRVPTMRLKVGLGVGDNFSKSFVASGKMTPIEDIESGSCFQVNLDAPGVLDQDGTLVVRCALEEVVSIPAQLRDMIPRLDERANWPKRL